MPDNWLDHLDQMETRINYRFDAVDSKLDLVPRLDERVKSLEDTKKWVVGGVWSAIAGLIGIMLTYVKALFAAPRH